MKYSSVIFDWDGTLGMTLHLWLKAYRATLSDLGFNYSDKVIIDDFFYEHIKTNLKYPEIDFPVFMKNVHNYMINNVSSLVLYEGVNEVLEKLKDNNITLALVSSSPKKLLMEELEQHRLSKFFSVIITSDDYKNHKPDPEPFLKVIEVAKINPKTTLVLGDATNDIMTAKATGIDFCFFLPKENKIFYDFNKLKESNPTYFVESLNDFIDIVLK